jgi:hypothetical protein
MAHLKDQRLKAMLKADQLVRAKRAVGNPVRGRLRSFGHSTAVAVGDQEVRRGLASRSPRSLTA